MTKEEFNKEKHLRKSVRKLVSDEKKKRKEQAMETGVPQGGYHGRLEEIADRPLLQGSHRETIEQALEEDKLVPAEVLADYPGLKD